MTDERFEHEWNSFWGNINTCGLSSFFNEDELKETMKTASAAMSEDTGCAYEGSLIVHINLLTGIALRLAKMISGTFKIDEESVMGICLIQHLSKISMFVKNDNQWEVEKRGLAFKFNSELKGKLKFGERSALMVLNKGVKLLPEEFEAIKCMDSDTYDKSGRGFESILTTIVRQANELAYAIEKEKYNNSKNLDI